MRWPAHLEKTARIAAFDEAMAVLRHDVRNRLASIRNAAFYLRRKAVGPAPIGEQDPRIPRFIDLIDAEAAAVEKSLAGRLRATESERQPIDLAALARQLVEAVTPPDQVEIRVAPGEPAHVEGDGTRLGVALCCLLENAVEALASPGIVRVEVERRGGVSVAVLDDGPGLGDITPERALEPFFSTRPGHLGIGLNVARTIAALHGGTIEIGAAPSGRGVRAAICIPGAKP